MPPLKPEQALNALVNEYNRCRDKYNGIIGSNAFADLFVCDDGDGAFVKIDENEVDLGAIAFDLDFLIKEFYFGNNAKPNSIIINSALTTISSILNEFKILLGDNVECRIDHPLLVGISPFEFHFSLSINATGYCKYGPDRKIYSGPFSDSCVIDANGRSVPLQIFSHKFRRSLHVIKFRDAADRNMYRSAEKLHE